MATVLSGAQVSPSGYPGPQGDAFPIGAIVDYCGAAEPAGWIFCYGQALARVGIYADLFAALGTTYGVGDGTTTFNIPDARGFVFAGRDNMGGSAANRLTTTWGVNGASLGANGGSQSHTLTVAQMPAHTHGGSIGTASAFWAIGTGSTIANLSPSGSTGGDAAHPNVQPTLIVNKIIKYAQVSLSPPTPGTGDVVGPNVSVDGNIAVFDGTTGKAIRAGGGLYSAGHLWGLTMSNGTDATNDINISNGSCRDSTNTVDMLLSATITKQLDAAWAAGTNVGGRDTGAIADGWWHVFVIKNPTTGVVDALFSLSATAPTLPSGYTLSRRIGSVARVTSALKAFLQYGDHFAIVGGTIFSVSATRALSLFAVPYCPVGIISYPILGFELTMPSNNAATFQVAPGNNSALLVSSIAKQGVGSVTATDILSFVSTNLNREIYLAVVLPVAPTVCNIYQYGYYDNRGKDGYSP